MKWTNKSKISIICIYIYMVVLILGISSCKKLVEVKPPVIGTTGASVYNTDVSAAAVLTGLYANFSQEGGAFTGFQSISLLSGLSADEFKLSDAVSNTDKLYYYYTNSLFSNRTGSFGTENWSNLYSYVYICNAAIEGISKSTKITPAIRQQLLGEAKFVRAFIYFYLVNLFDAVPLAVLPDYAINSRLSRSSAAEVYQQIISDLLEAKDLLSDQYLSADALTGTSDRLRPTKWAAIALLSRVYLYLGDYANAEIQATAVINNSSLFSLVPLNNVFLANSEETIWQLQPVNFGWNTEDANVFVINQAPGSSKPISLSQSFMNSFEVDDARKTSWTKDTIINGIDLPYPYKYQVADFGAPVSEFLMVLRLGEQYLIRAEARAQLNNTSGSQSDLNVIRNRAQLSNTTANDKNSLLAAILHERQIELFSEWGHRWFDLKRTNNIESVMSSACLQKGGSWQNYQQFYPILYTEIEKDQNLTQNKGY